jgi:hypothetical protein
MKIIFEILSPRPSATNYATFSTLADAKAALADPTRFPEMQGYRRRPGHFVIVSLFKRAVLRARMSDPHDRLTSRSKRKVPK